MTRQPAGIEIRIADTGIGISEAAAPYVFDRFFRADEARSRRSGGIGLGLSIVKWIAEAHDGRVRLAGRPGGGSEFTVDLPARMTEAAPDSQGRGQ
jgi:two-component system sensor histidine kinase SenX3